ncbi:diacylglycerol O-acyltransferase 2 [Tieghemostelium lacteum]|uniref:Acyltransferase n=1 Tax=Tieghemostelium lacteum TaxID=361077 RepID=A0A151ZJ89_TIELA|nr:diacylglycerol O-acyltransferase 2 [Tieghemostelium lacteum]|eukprot:KYQ93987.1 diacylglycerol O-acyltransferase 2 [Tieghemostelium lacteum]
MRFSIFNVPLERRLQTLSVLIYALVTPFALICAFYLIVIPIFYGFTVPYLIWIIYWDKRHETGGYKWKFVRNLKLWKYFKDYFPISLRASSKLDPEKNYIFGIHPHGIISIGAFCNFGTNANGIDHAFPGVNIHLLTLDSNFRIPFLREILLSLGIGSVSKKSCTNILNSGKGQSICIVIGGAEESLDAHPGNNEITLKNRKGFVKLALNNGASLVPVYSFGENDVYDQVSNPRGSYIRRIQTKIKNITGIAPPLIRGRGVFSYDFGLLPQRHPIVSVIGSPIDIPKVNNPSEELIDHYHKLYIDSLNELFENYKKEFHEIPEDTHLKIN